MAIIVNRFSVEHEESLIVFYRLPGFSGSVAHALSKGLKIVKETGYCDNDDATRAALEAGMGDPTITVSVDTKIRGIVTNCVLLDVKYPGNNETPGSQVTGVWVPVIPYERIWKQIAAGGGS